MNKERARSGEAREKSRTSTKDLSSSRRGGLRSHKGPGGRTYRQLYAEAYGTTLGPNELEFRDPYLTELRAIAVHATERRGPRPMIVTEREAAGFGRLADALNRTRQDRA